MGSLGAVALARVRHTSSIRKRTWLDRMLASLCDPLLPVNAVILAHGVCHIPASRRMPSLAWEKYGVTIEDDERKSAAFVADKRALHDNGIKLNRVRRRLGTCFEGLF